MSKQTERNKDQRVQRVMEILQSHGIRMATSGCSCCENPYIRFEYNGELITYDGQYGFEGCFFFDMFEQEE